MVLCTCLLACWSTLLTDCVPCNVFVLFVCLFVCLLLGYICPLICSNANLVEQWGRFSRNLPEYYVSYCQLFAMSYCKFFRPAFSRNALFSPKNRLTEGNWQILREIRRIGKTMRTTGLACMIIVLVEITTLAALAHFFAAG